MVLWQHEDNWLVTVEMGGGKTEIGHCVAAKSFASNLTQCTGNQALTDDNCKMEICQLWSMK